MKQFILLFLLCSTLLSTAQVKPAVVIGPELKSNKMAISSTIIGSDDTGYYVAIMEKKGLFKYQYTLRKLGKDLSDVKTVILPDEDPELKGDLYIKDVLFVNNKLLLFRITYDRKTMLQVLYGSELNTTTLEKTGKVIKIAESKGMSLGVEESEDHQSVIITTNEGDKKKVKGYDASFQVLWEETREDDTERNAQKLVDKNGNTVLLIKDGSKYTVKSIEAGNKTNPVIYDISLSDGKFITDARIDRAANGDIIAAGFYSTENPETTSDVVVHDRIDNKTTLSGQQGIEGIFYTVLDSKTKNVKTAASKPFAIEFVTAGMREGAAERAEKREANGKNVEMSGYKLDFIVIRDNGEIVLISEKYHESSSKEKYYTPIGSANPNQKMVSGKPPTRYYHYMDLIAVDIDTKGDIKWNVKIPKRQISRDDYGLYSSYAFIYDKETLHFVFNDDKENIGKTSGQVSNFEPGNKFGMVAIASVKNDGTFTREQLVGNEAIDIKVRPKVYSTVNNELILMGERFMKDQFIKVTFN